MRTMTPPRRTLPMTTKGPPNQLTTDRAPSKVLIMYKMRKRRVRMISYNWKLTH